MEKTKCRIIAIKAAEAYILYELALVDSEDMRRAVVEAYRNNLSYSFVVNVKDLKEICQDKLGRITKFVFVEPDAYQEQTMATRTLTAEGWELIDSKGKHSGTWNLGRVPVVPLVSKVRISHNPFPPSEYLSVAKSTLAIYNMCRW